jgi:hypothetical protein
MNFILMFLIQALYGAYLADQLGLVESEAMRARMGAILSVERKHRGIR